MDRYQAWLDLITVRDNYYLYAVTLVALGYVWYRFLTRSLKKWAFRLAVFVFGLVMMAAWLWGLGSLVSL